MKRIPAAHIFIATCFVAASALGAAAQYDFNSNLNSSTTGAALTTGFAAPASSAGVTFSNVTINGNVAQTAFFTRGTFFRMTHGLGSNSGGNRLNQYTFIFDVMFPSRPSG